MKKQLLILSIILLVLTFAGCSSKREAVGNDDQIIVVADSSNYSQLEGTLLMVLSKTIYTPQAENLFTLRRINVEDLPKFNKWKNILIISPLNTKTPTTKYIKSILDSTVLNLVKSGKEFSFIKKNLWALHQMVLIATAPTVEELKADLLKENKNILYYFKKASDERLMARMFRPKFENRAIADSLLKEHDWTIFVQADFKVAIDSAKANFVWLRRAMNSDMERWVFVKWWDNASPSMLSKDSVDVLRNRITKEFYTTADDSAHVEIADNFMIKKEVNFNGRYAIMTQGLWRMSDKSMGGPFVNYLFYDKAQRRVYMLDASIYAPKYYKKKIIQQVDVMLHTFKTRDEIKAEKKNNK